jgi:hypothetical protein
LGSVSTGDANFVGAGTGLPPNICLSISDFGITRAVFTNNLGTGNTFTLDDFTFTRSTIAGDPPHAVPAPAIGAGLPGLIAACGGFVVWWRRKRRAQAVA